MGETGSVDIINDAQILRRGIEEELKAISLYESLSNKAKAPAIKKLFLDIAEEEKKHVGEFENLLIQADTTYDKSKKEGAIEADRKVGILVGESVGIIGVIRETIT